MSRQAKKILEFGDADSSSTSYHIEFSPEDLFIFKAQVADTDRVLELRFRNDGKINAILYQNDKMMLRATANNVVDALTEILHYAHSLATNVAFLPDHHILVFMQSSAHLAQENLKAQRKKRRGAGYLALKEFKQKKASAKKREKKKKKFEKYESLFPTKKKRTIINSDEFTPTIPTKTASNVNSEPYQPPKPLVSDCRHGIPAESCPRCASWGSDYDIRQYD